MVGTDNIGCDENILPNLEHEMVGMMGQMMDLLHSWGYWTSFPV
jgi:hypothetical protein